MSRPVNLVSIMGNDWRYVGKRSRTCGDFTVTGSYTATGEWSSGHGASTTGRGWSGNGILTSTLSSRYWTDTVPPRWPDTGSRATFWDLV